MADVGTLLMKVDADTKQFEKGMSRSRMAIKNTAKAVKTGALVIGIAMAGAAAKAVQLAAEAEEVQNKFDVTFKTMSKDAEDWAKTYSKSVGRSVNDTKEFISNIADLQQGLGMSEKSSLDLSKKIVELGTDLASFNNVNDATAIEAVQKALLGEAESAKQLGLLLNVDRVKAFAEAQGLVWKEVTDAERALLTYELAVTQSQNAIGDAERSSGSFTNQMKALKSTVKDATVSFGTQLIPIVTKLIVYVNESVIPGIAKMKEGFLNFVNLVKPVFIEAFNRIKERMMLVKDFIDSNLLPVIENLVTWVISNMPLFKSMFEEVMLRVRDVTETLWAFFRDNLLPIIQSLVAWVVENAPQIRDIFVSVFEKVLVVADSLWAFFKDYILPIISSLLDLAKDVFPKIWDAFKPAFDKILELAGTLWTFFSDNLLPIFSAIFDKVKEVIPKLAPYFDTAFVLIGSIIETAVKVIEGIITTISNLFDWAVKAIAKVQEFLGLDGSEITVTENIVEKRTRSSGQDTGRRGGRVDGPKANGGPVSGGASYLVGEKGPEIFTPSGSGAIAAGGNNVTINVNGTTDPNLIMDKVVRILNQQGIINRG